MKEPLLDRLSSLEIDRDDDKNGDDSFSILPWKLDCQGYIGNQESICHILIYSLQKQKMIHFNHWGAVANFGLHYNLHVVLEACFIFGQSDEFEHT